MDYRTKRSLFIVLMLTLGLWQGLQAETNDPAPATRQLFGQVLYQARIALPEYAQVLVMAEGPFGRTLDIERFTTKGQQVPLGFSLEIPQRLEARLHAAILIQGRTRWLSDTINIAPCTEDADLGDILLHPHAAMLHDLRYRCGDRDINVGFLDDYAVLRLDGERLILPQVRSASGARFATGADAGPGDADSAQAAEHSADTPAETSFWVKGDAAMAVIRGESLPNCELIPLEPPTAFQARGQEPNWFLEIAQGQLRLLLDLGQRVIEAPIPKPVIRDGRLAYEVSDPALTISLDRQLCHDSMSGMPYPEQVQVRVDGETLRGCGGDPLDLLRGTNWIVEIPADDLIPEDVEVPANALTTGETSAIATAEAHQTEAQTERLTESPMVARLQFTEEGTLTGTSGCNQFQAGLVLTGEHLSIGPTAATMRACSPRLMTQERWFFKALDQTRRFDLDADGRLLLIGEDGQPPLLRAQRQ